MRKADKRKIGEERQAQNRAFARQSGLVAQKHDRERREKAKRDAEAGPVKVRKLPKKDAPKKFGKVSTTTLSPEARGRLIDSSKKITESFKGVGVAAQKATDAIDRSRVKNQFSGDGLQPGS